LVPSGTSTGIDRTITAFKRLPSQLVHNVDWVVIHEGRNPQDSYWQAHYKNFTEASATGGSTGAGRETVIHVYASGLASHEAEYLNIMRHELGHNIAVKAWGSPEPHVNYASFANKDSHVVSEYCRNAWSEDFAETIREYLGSRGGTTASGRHLRVEVAYRFNFLDQLFNVSVPWWSNEGRLNQLIERLGNDHDLNARMSRIWHDLAPRIDRNTGAFRLNGHGEEETMNLNIFYNEATKTLLIF
jgi:hypothetical protein